MKIMISTLFLIGVALQPINALAEFKYIDDVLLSNEAQSGSEQKVSEDFLKEEVYNKTHGKNYGNNKVIEVSIKQKAKGAICPRSQNASSVTKISCDHFVVTSSHEVSSEFKPSVKMGVYREMIHSNSATHKDMDVSG